MSPVRCLKEIGNALIVAQILQNFLLSLLLTDQFTVENVTKRGDPNSDVKNKNRPIPYGRAAFVFNVGIGISSFGGILDSKLVCRQKAQKEVL